ncbi:hypothetical protein LZ31DRAFT_485986 [Colletotrichum somersetense]|nr:hypothetical protein LZ31DRAFT_485986 [Colletotrichum somersetense]
MLYKEVPQFESTWIECIGDMGRYRIQIVDDGTDIRETWRRDSQQWFLKASDKGPEVGRLYHHLATMAPNALEQLFYYAKSLCVSVPFLNSRKTMTDFLFALYATGCPKPSAEKDAAYLSAHAILFTGKNKEQFMPWVSLFVGNLNNFIEENKDHWLVSGYQIGISLACAILEYGSASNLVVRSIESEKGEGKQNDDPNTLSAHPGFLNAIELAAQTHDVVLRRSSDANVLPYLHVTLSFLHHMSKLKMAMGYIGVRMPWKLIMSVLNKLLEDCISADQIESDAFPRHKKTSTPLSEDFAQRELLWVKDYYPEDWFTTMNYEYHMVTEEPWMMQERIHRCLWLGVRIASSEQWLTYDKLARKFGVRLEYDVNLDM